MRTPLYILVVDDQPMHVDIRKTRRAVHGYVILTMLVLRTAIAPPVWRGEHALFCWCRGHKNWWRISAVRH